ncbi:hypothetical protein IG631_09330 [Alternaria alternata]|nr:hypothetical protein IG631_09330 [Alternaria alternata]
MSRHECSCAVGMNSCRYFPLIETHGTGYPLTQSLFAGHWLGLFFPFHHPVYGAEQIAGGWENGGAAQSTPHA